MLPANHFFDDRKGTAALRILPLGGAQSRLWGTRALIVRRMMRLAYHVTDYRGGYFSLWNQFDPPSFVANRTDGWGDSWLPAQTRSDETPMTPAAKPRGPARPPTKSAG
jgi:hypothetical protein